MKSAEILAEVKKLLQEQMQVVTYKWLARQYGLPANTAKQLLYYFFEQNRKIAKATFLLAGWTKEEPRTHVVKLVDASRVLAVRDTLQPLTSYHAYSVQPSKPQDSAALSNTDYVQLEELFQQLLKAPDAEASAQNCLADNRYSGVCCSAAIRDLSLTKRPSDPAVAAAIAAERAAAEAAEAKLNGKRKASSAPGKSLQRAGSSPTGKQDKGPIGTQKVTGSKSASAASHLSGLWTKAPPKKEPTAAALPAKAASNGRGGKKAAAAPAADADAALRAAQEDESSDDDDDFRPAQRGGQSSAQNNSAMLVDDEAGEEEDDQDELPAKVAARSADARGRRTVLEDSSDEEMGDAQPQPATGGGDDLEVDLDIKSEVVEDGKPAKGAKRAKAPVKRTRKPKGGSDNADGDEGTEVEKDTAGRVKLSSNAPGGRKRRKVTKTSYNDKGEEITEVLWEEEAAAEPAAAEPAAAAGSAHVGSQAEANSDANGSMALRERQANEPAVSEGNSGQAAKKASSPKKASKPVGKAVGKGSIKGKTDRNQRGIMSFFKNK